MCVTGPKAQFERLRTSRDREFERLGVNLLCYIEKKNGTAVLLREIENFERSEFEPSRVTCTYPFFSFSIRTSSHSQVGKLTMSEKTVLQSDSGRFTLTHFFFSKNATSPICCGLEVTPSKIGELNPKYFCLI